MTDLQKTPNQPNPQSILILSEILAALQAQKTMLAAILAELQASHTQTQTVDEALTRLASVYQSGSASQPGQPTNRANTLVITVDTITKASDENGKLVYKARGGMYRTYGIRIWPETFPLLGIKPESLEYGQNQIEPVNMAAACNENGSPRKIIGLA